MNLVILVITFLFMNQRKYCEKICKVTKFTYEGGINGAVDTMLLCSICQHEKTICTKINDLPNLSFSAL